MKLNGIESIKILIADASVDPVSNFRIIRLIEDNFEKYFQENRQPSEKQQREIHNPRAVYFNTY